MREEMWNAESFFPKPEQCPYRMGWLPRALFWCALALYGFGVGCTTTKMEGADEASPVRKLEGSLNAFAIVHDWIKNYDESEEAQHQLEVMKPTQHVLYGRSVPMDTISSSVISTYIVGGEPVEAAEPWFVMLLEYNATRGEWQFAGCGGTLIASRYVLTAAHCVQDKLSKPRQTAVLVQAFRPFARGNGGLDAHFSRVESFEVHNEFSSVRFDKDVALIRLARPANIESFAPIELADTSFGINNEDIVTIFGFGLTSEGADDHSSVLREVDVPYVSPDTCRAYYGYQITDDMVCAGLQEGGKDACAGDSGGPLVKKGDDEKFQLVGIVSWGDGCARANSPGVYTSVSFYYQWIAYRVCADPDMQVELVDTLCRIKTDVPTNPPTSRPTQYPTGYGYVAFKEISSQDFTKSPAALDIFNRSPTNRPTTNPSRKPTIVPTFIPSTIPSWTPVARATNSPVSQPTHRPTHRPTSSPSVPSARPTQPPSVRTTKSPVNQPIRRPSMRPTRSPTAPPTRSPRARATQTPSTLPVASPTRSPIKESVSTTSCLPMDAPCLPWSGPSCCTGVCIEWWGEGNDTFLCSNEDFGKKGKSKKKGKSSSDDRRGR